MTNTKEGFGNDESVKNISFEETAHRNAAKKAEAIQKASNPTPVVTPASDKVSFEPPAGKNISGYEKLASNDGTLVLSGLNDKTNVQEGVVMENQAREPAHQQHELALETDAPGFEQSAALMLPRGSVHYDNVADVKAFR